MYIIMIIMCYINYHIRPKINNFMQIMPRECVQSFRPGLDTKGSGTHTNLSIEISKTKNYMYQTL